MNRINALSAVKAVGSSTSDSSNKHGFQQQIKAGQTFAATIMEPAGNDRFFLNILDNKILAQSNTVSLPRGTKLNLQVIDTSPLLELRIISKTPELFFGKTLTLLGKSLNIDGLFQSLTSSDSPLLKQMTPTTQKGLSDFNALQQLPIDTQNGGEYLKQLMDRLGLSLEVLLAGGNNTKATQSLKAALLEIATHMKDATELAETTSKLLGTLELFQLAQLRLESDNLLIFPLPLPYLDNGYLLIEENKDKQSTSDNNAIRYSIHLVIEPLGNIEISFFQTIDGLYLTVSCESVEKKEFLNQHLDLLKDTLLSSEILGMSVNEHAGDPINDLIQKLVPAGEAMLDTKI
jgi:hypothetical protein